MTQLSDIVAILSPDFASVIEVRDLGPDPVDVKPGRALPLVEDKPELAAGQVYGEPTYTIGPDAVTRTWPVVQEMLSDLLPFQFRAMLKLSGQEAALTAFLDALTDPAKSIAQAKLEYSLSFQRDNDLVEQARQALGLTDAQLDALWAQAATIT